MRASYISYFEGYDANGRLVYSGNAPCLVTYDEVEGVNPEKLLDDYCPYLLGAAQKVCADVVGVCIKNMIKL